MHSMNLNTSYAFIFGYLHHRVEIYELAVLIYVVESPPHKILTYKESVCALDHISHIFFIVIISSNFFIKTIYFNLGWVQFSLVFFV